MTFKFSKRSSKYVWFSLPGLLSIGLSLGWLTSVAPQTQQASRKENQWRQELTAQKDRAEFLEENAIHSDYDQATFQGVTASQPDLSSVLWQWSRGPMGQTYRDGQTIRLLDQYHACMGYLVSGKGIYLDSDNPGLCGASNADIDQTLKSSKPI